MADKEHTHHPNYLKIYIALVVLLTISVLGNYTGVMWVTLIIAFGVALLKANLVVQNFMHLKVERRIVKWALTTALMLVVLFLAGTSPDVMKHDGLQWVNNSVREEITRGIPLSPEEASKPVAPVPLTYPEAASPRLAPTSGADTTAAASGDSVHTTARVDPPSSGSGAGMHVALASVLPLPHPQSFDAKATFNSVCAACHGKDGRGNGPAAAGMNPKPADFNSPAFWKAAPDSVLFKAIKDGGASVGKSPLMVAWGGTYSDADIHALVKYIETTFRPKAVGGE